MKTVYDCRISRPVGEGAELVLAMIWGAPTTQPALDLFLAWRAAQPKQVLTLTLARKQAGRRL